MNYLLNKGGYMVLSKTLILTLSIVFLFFNSCSNNHFPKKPTPNQITELFQKDTSVTPETTYIPFDTSIQIIIDGSNSMAGFNNSGGTSVFSLFLKDLISSKSFGAHKLRLYRLVGNTVESVKENMIWDASVRDAFFDQGETRLGDLIQKISAIPDSELASAYIVISDGVISTLENLPGYGGMMSDYTLMIREANKWQDEHGFPLRIIGVRSQFSGTAYSEYNKLIGLPHRLLTPYNSTSDINSYRPFYIYIFTPNRSLTDELTLHFEGFNSIKDNCRSIDCQPDLVQQSKLKFTVPSRLSRESVNPLRPLKFPDDKFPNILYVRWKPRDKFISGSGKVNVRLDILLSNLARSYLDTLENVKVIADTCYLIEYKKIMPLCLKDQIRYRAKPIYLKPKDVSQGRSSCDLEFEIVPDDKPGWYIYHLLVYPDQNTIETPNWVKEWSTECDSSLSNYNRTYNLESIVRGLLRNKRLTNQLLSEFFIVLEKRS
jgi:hypothetical protein